MTTSPSTSATVPTSSRPTSRCPRGARCAASTSPTSRPGQGKYVTALTGALVDYVVDIRVGSPTFGQWEAVHLDPVDRRAVWLSEGLGHAFCALEDDTTAMYLCSATYTPSGEHGIHPLDPEVGLELPDGIEPLLSPKDAAAPSLSEARASGLLPTLEATTAWAAHLGGLSGSSG